MSEKQQYPRIVTPEFTVVWPHLFEPYDYKGRADQAKYSAEMMFDDPDDIAELIDTAKEVAKKEWPDTKMKKVNFPFKRGDDIITASEKKGKGKNLGYYKDKIVLRGRSTYQPVICDSDHKDVIDSRKIYAGCVGMAELTFVPYENELVGKGVTCYLNAYMHVAEGQRIGGRDTRKIFGTVSGRSDVDPEEGDDDEIDEDDLF